ncbi:MAG: CysS/YqeB C-terminal domain-containing protein, partial [Gammaproteobacteria bacterium]
LIEDPEEFLCQSSKNFKPNSNVLATQEIEELIAKRNLARKTKDWKLADLIRQDLAKQGILLEDQGGQTTWRRG